MRKDPFASLGSKLGQVVVPGPVAAGLSYATQTAVPRLAEAPYGPVPSGFALGMVPGIETFLRDFVAPVVLFGADRIARLPPSDGRQVIARLALPDPTPEIVTGCWRWAMRAVQKGPADPQLVPAIRRLVEVDGRPIGQFVLAAALHKVGDLPGAIAALEAKLDVMPAELAPRARALLESWR
jgi:hypothetical protein